VGSSWRWRRPDRHLRDGQQLLDSERQLLHGRRVAQGPGRAAGRRAALHHHGRRGRSASRPPPPPPPLVGHHHGRRGANPGRPHAAACRIRPAACRVRAAAGLWRSAVVGRAAEHHGRLLSAAGRRWPPAAAECRAVRCSASAYSAPDHDGGRCAGAAAHAYRRRRAGAPPPPANGRRRAAGPSSPPPTDGRGGPAGAPPPRQDDGRRHAGSRRSLRSPLSAGLAPWSLPPLPSLIALLCVLLLCATIHLFQVADFLLFCCRRCSPSSSSSKPRAAGAPLAYCHNHNYMLCTSLPLPLPLALLAAMAAPLLPP